MTSDERAELLATLIDAIRENQGVDLETWRFITLCLNDGNPMIELLGAHVLMHAVQENLAPRDIALALLEAKVAEGGEYGAVWFGKFAQVLRLDRSRKYRDELAALRPRLSELLDEDRRSVLNRVLSDSDAAVRRSCAEILISAAVRNDSNKAFVLNLIENQLTTARGEDELFWTVARAAVLDGYPAEHAGPRGYEGGHSLRSVGP